MARGVPAVAGLVAALALAGALSGCNTQPKSLPGAANPVLSLSAVDGGSPTATPSGTPAARLTGTPTGTPSDTPSDTGTPTATPQLPTLGYESELVLPTLWARRPVGWDRTEQGDRVDFRDPSGTLLLRFEPFADPTQSPDAAVRGLAASTAKNYPDYQQVALVGPVSHAVPELVTGSYGEWEFTFTKDGETRKVVIRGVGGQASVGAPQTVLGLVYFSAPAGDFARLVPIFREAVGSVRSNP